MLVRCPRCFTTYRVSDRLITTPNPIFRCSRCKHVFVLELKPETKAGQDKVFSPHVPPQQHEEEDRELTFSFSAVETGSTEEKAEEDHDLAESPETPLTDNQDQRTAPPGPMRAEFPPPQEAADATPLRDQPPPEPKETEDRDKHLTFLLEEDHAPSSRKDWKLGPEPARAEQDFTLWEKERETSALANPRLGGPLSVVPYLSLFGVLIFTFSLITLMYQARPAGLESFIRAIPWYGPLVLKNSYLRQGIALRSLRSGYQTIHGDREVFLISGEVANDNAVSVREVRVEGHLYNAEGKEIGRQAISVGNAISAKIIRDMTAREIAILQRLSPQKKFEIPPGESVPFTIVFLKPTREIKTFSCRLLAAKRGT
ncbi:MAG: zinc-ribbon domain-containing protein [Candidatus Binatia bacterium]